MVDKKTPQNKIADFGRLVKILLNREGSKMNGNIQNARIASITEKLWLSELMWEVRSTMPGHSTDTTTSTQRNCWSSATAKPASRHSRHGWRSSQESMAKMLWFPGWDWRAITGSPWENSWRTTVWSRYMWILTNHVKKSKELDDNNSNKNDRKAPKTIAVLANEGRYSYPSILTGIYAEIRSLSDLRFQT